jgi:HEAT repeat protein
MSVEDILSDLADPAKKPSATQLANLSELSDADAQFLAEEWPDLDASRRLSVMSELADLAIDNVELNFDAIFKLGLEDEEAAVRAAAIRGLHEYEERDLIAPLAGLLRNDPDAAVRREAAIALGRYAVVAELGYLADRDAQALRDALIESAEDLDEDELVRARAIEAAGALSGEDTENLIESIYQEDSPWLRIGAIDAMGRSANEMWLPTILREMENPEPEMRHAAAFAAGEIGDEEAIPSLKLLALDDPDREVQLAAVHALGEIGGPRAKVALQSLLYEGDDDLREPVEEAMTEAAFDENPFSPF